MNGYPIKRTGCCQSCDGLGYGGSASGSETNGLCWDCQGTGHPHAGRCRSRFLDWWHLKEHAVVMTAMVWTILTTAFGAVVFPPATHAWAPCVSVGPMVLAVVGMIILGRLSDRQIQRYGLPPARTDQRG